MKNIPFHFPSKTGVCEINAHIYTPEDGYFETVMVIHHGMAEHQKRYEGYIRFLCDHGIAVYMHDMANHGESNQDPELKGWFGKRGGWNALIEDYREMVLRAKQEHPSCRIIVMGHSMGSFIVRMYVSRYPQDGFAGAIFMGTGGPNPAAGAGKAAAAVIGAVRGKKHKSNLMNTMAFGTYGKKFEGRTAFDWLTRDREIVDRYVADSYCGFLFTVQGMSDLVRVNAASNTAAWARGIPNELPILLISGGLDPVGDYGAGVQKVAEMLRESGHTRVTTKIYPECRHEVLNELNRDEVMNDIAAWIKEI